MKNLNPNSLEARLRARLQNEGSDAFAAVFASAKAACLGRLAQAVQAEARAYGLYLV